MLSTKLHSQLRNLTVRLACVAAKSERREIPKYRYDGEELTAPEDVAGVLGIPVYEAKARLGLIDIKDVFGNQSAHNVSVGVGTRMGRSKIYERVNALLNKKKRKKRKRRGK